MLTGLSISTPSGDSLSLPIPSGGDGYLVTEIEGLDPVPVAHSSSNYTQLDGEFYHTSRREKRNIILHIKLKKNWWTTTMDYRRNRLYSLFAPKHNLTLTFNTPLHGNVTINGRVESVDATMWTDEPSVIVSIVCFDPVFRAVSPVVNTYLFNHYETPTWYEYFTYTGTIYTGITLSVVDWELSTAISNGLIFTNQIGTGPTVTMDFESNFLQWDRLSFSTIPGAKYARVTKQNNSVVSVIDKFSSSSKWIMFGPGINKFYASTGGNDEGRKYSLSYYPLYGGI